MLCYAVQVKTMKPISEALRSNQWRCFIKKGVLKTFTKLTGKHLCKSLFFIKVAGLRSFLTLTKVAFHGFIFSVGGKITPSLSETR